MGLLVVMAIGFQNCGEVGLEEPKEHSFSSSISTAQGLLCLDSDETLESFYVSNLNSKMVGGFMQMDSDADGLSDLEEEAQGTNPLDRRTSKSILDSICRTVDYNVRCESINVVCSGASNALGINDCDQKALRLEELYDHPNHGLDSDKDGMPDLLEIRAGSFPNIADETADPDRDLRENQVELGVGSDLRRADGGFPREYQVLIRKTKLAPATDCRGERWEVAVEQVPLVRTQVYESLSEPWLSHERDENVIVLVFKTRPKVGASRNARLFRLAKKVQVPVSQAGGAILDFSFTTASFTMVGEVEP